MKRRHYSACGTMCLAIMAPALAGPAFIGPSATGSTVIGTLRKIQNEHVIAIGYREASVPFSYYDAQAKPIGYSIDIANLIVERIKSELRLRELQVRMIPITSQNRVALLQNGTIDFECTSTSNNAARARQVAFSNNFFTTGTRLLVRKDSGIRDFPDLKGESVVVGAGTTSEQILRRMNVEKSMNMIIISSRDHADTFLTFSTGRARAMMMDEALLVGERAKAFNPDDYEIVGTPQSFESYACMLRKDDAHMKALMDVVIANAEQSGLAERIYTRWFLRPIPPKHLDLDLPMSARMKALFSQPNDSPVSE